MDIEILKKLIKQNKAKHSEFVCNYAKSKNYYMNKPDIVFSSSKSLYDGINGETLENPLRNANNHVPFNFHGLLVNQKASYMFTKAPSFDLGSEVANKKLNNLLGDKFTKVCKDLCVNASNSSVAWLHIWKENSDLKYTVIEPSEILAVWDKGVDRKLLGVLRTYSDIREEDGKAVIRYEYWNDIYCYFYEKESEDDSLITLHELSIDESGNNSFRHDIGDVPFIAFFNNNVGTSDLINIKDLIDTYCKVYNGFVNDLEDIQEVILVLTNYGGENRAEFLKDLKEYKMIQLDTESSGDVKTLSIDIPIEARRELLNTTRKLIFEQGMGIDPDPANFGNSSGVALQFLYALLELKAGLMETEFRISFSKFIRVICKAYGIAIKDESITQVWTRTSVKNTSELVDMCAKSKGLISDETLLSHHPFVSDVARELEKIEEEKKQAEQKLLDLYGFDDKKQTKDDEKKKEKEDVKEN